MKSLILFIFITVLITVSWFWLDKNQPEPKTTLREIPVMHVMVTKAIQEDIQPLTKATGRLVPARTTKLHFEVSGQVIQQRVEAGQKVTTGEVLVEIDAADYDDIYSEMQINLQQEQAGVARDKKLLALVSRQVTLLQREVNRLEKLKKQSLISQSKIDETKRAVLRERTQLEELQHSLKTSENRLKMREVALNKAQRNVDRTRLKAPFSGTVNQVQVAIGDYLTPGMLVVELVQLEQLNLMVELAGKEVAALEIGQTLTVHVGDKDHQGTLISIQYDPDPVTHTHAVKISLKAEDLIPGKLASVQITGQRMNRVILVPTTAVLREDGNSFVFVVSNDRISKIPIQILGRENGRFLVEGLTANDVIVARDVAALEDGQQVVID